MPSSAARNAPPGVAAPNVVTPKVSGLDTTLPRAAMPDVPVWALVVGALLVVVFVLFSIEAYSGTSLADRLPSRFWTHERLASGETLRAFYAPGDAVRVGQPGIGSRAQERTLLPGDAVLLGESRRLVRVESGARTRPIDADVGTVVTLVNLGSWDGSAARLSGLPARRSAEGWSVDGASVAQIGADLFAPGAPEEEVGEGFGLNPDESAGRIRRGTEDGVPVVRLRANRAGPYLGIESESQLPTLDNAVVTVRVVVRARSSGMVGLTVFDTVDANGTIENSSDRRTVGEDGWTELTVRRRMTLPSPGDKLSLGIYQPRSGDWVDVRELRVYLGALP